MNELHIFNSEEFGDIRTVTIDNEPWFVGKDVATALGYKNTADAIGKTKQVIFILNQQAFISFHLLGMAVPVNTLQVDKKRKTIERSRMNDLTVTEYKNIRVLTTQQIAEAYGTDTKVVSYNFNHNKDRYVDGKHYICLTGDELRAFRENHDLPSNLNKLYLWTEKGAFLHAKSLNTDRAWEVYDRLVDEYFEKPKLPSWTMDDKIQILAQGNIELKEKIEAVNDDLQEFKRDMPLLALECQKITKAKNQKVVPILGGKNAPAYKDNSLRQLVYSDIDAQLRREFGVNTYKAIKRNQCDMAIKIINEYELPMYLKDRIDDANAQSSFL